MKLTGITIDGYRKLNNIRLLQISPAMNLIYGEKGTGKTRLADFISGILFGEATDVHNVGHRRALNSGEPIEGRLDVNSGHQQYSLLRDLHTGNRLTAQATSSAGAAGTAIGAASDPQTLITGALDLELFNSFFSVCFDTRATGLNSQPNKHLPSSLHRRMGVPLGQEHSGETSVNPQQIQTANALRSEIESVNRTIASLQLQSQQLNAQINASASSAVRAGQLDQQIAEIERRIVALTAQPNSHELALITSQIEQLQLQINSAQPTYVAPVVPTVNASAAVYDQLDEIDTQINRWRSVQNEVQQQRVSLKDEMVQWNEMTLDSEHHPYHDARRILLNLEKRVDSAHLQTGQWLDSHGPTDSYQAAGFVDEVCDRMRDDLYVLCEELGKQYKQIRHRSAAAELKRLRRFYEQITENVTRLIARRRAVIQQLRDLDAAGADAILRADHDYSVYAAKEGHLRARERFVGPINMPSAVPQMVAPDLTQQRNQLLVLENRRAELQRHHSPNTLEMTQLRSQITNLRNERASLTSADTSQSKSELARVQVELNAAMAALQSLNLRLDEASKTVQVTPNALLVEAGQILARLSHGELSRVWLTQNGDQTEIQVLDRQQRVLGFSAISATMRAQTQLSLILAANQILSAQNISAPLIIDELFEDFDSDRIDTALQVLSEFSARGHQVIMLTQHRFLIDRANNFATIQFFDIQSQKALESHPPVINPTFGPTMPVPSPVPSPATIAFSTASSFSANGANPSPPVVQHVSTIAGPAVQLQENVTARFPEPAVHRYQPAATPVVSSIKANQIGDRLVYAVTYEDHSALAEIPIFDALQLRTFNDSGIVSVADLLDVNLDDLPPNWHEVGLTRAVVDSMQAEIWLLSCVPALRPYDAHVLVACGIFEPDQLETSAPQFLLERVQRYLKAHENENDFDDSYRITLERIKDWHKGIGKTHKRWRNRRAGRNRRMTERDSQNRRFDRTSNRDRSGEYDRKTVESQTRGPQLRRYEENGSSSSRNGFTQRSGVEREYEDRSQNRSRSRSHDRDYDGDRGRDRADNIIRADRSSARSRDAQRPMPARTPRMEIPTPETYRRSVPALAPESSTMVDSAQEQIRETKPAATRTTAKSSSKAKLKFYLDLEDHIEAAPSIGPKTAERFEKIGVFTISDFLRQTAESMATKLNYKRMTSEVIRSWQHQARLVCRIPNLRGHDAQLLVACDLIEPEEIASMQPQSLYQVMGPFSETKEGLKIIRSGKKPDLAEITDWIAWAQHTRSLQAA